jgi:hypothetical protein
MSAMFPPAASTAKQELCWLSVGKRGAGIPPAAFSIDPIGLRLRPMANARSHDLSNDAIE